MFDEFPSTGEHHKRLAELRAEHVELFISSQLDRHTAAAAANRYRSLQSFFKWAAAEAEIEEANDAFRNLKSPVRAARFTMTARYKSEYSQTRKQ